MSKRNEGIDLLRCLAMMMVAMLHIMNHGGVLGATTPGTPAYNIAWLLQTSGFCAVNCYALISGYVGVKAEHRYRRMIPLWLQVTFYSVLITGLFFLFRPGTVDTKALAAAFFPVIHQTYWYFTAYFGLFCLMPLINRGLQSMRKREAKRFLLVLLAGFSVFSTLPYLNVTGTFSQEDPFKLHDGFSLIWLAVMYIAGGCIRLHDLGKDVQPWKLAAGFVAAIVCTWYFKLQVEESASAWLKTAVDPLALLYYPAPTMVIAALCLLLLFARCKQLPAWLGKAVSFLAPSVFSVYLIHEHKLIRQHLISGRFAGLAGGTPGAMAVSVLAAAAAIFVVCCLIDQVRRMIFHELRIRQLVNSIPESSGDE